MTGTRDRLRYPCATVLPNGPCAARSGSTWIHWWSPVASANASMRSCGTSTQDEGPNSAPGFRSVAIEQAGGALGRLLDGRVRLVVGSRATARAERRPDPLG